jgi:hypothetical protein
MHCPKLALCTFGTGTSHACILHVMDTVRVTSFLADFYALFTSASLEYAISSVIHIPAFSTYSSDADVDYA